MRLMFQWLVGYFCLVVELPPASNGATSSTSDTQDFPVKRHLPREGIARPKNISFVGLTDIVKAHIQFFFSFLEEKK